MMATFSDWEDPDIDEMKKTMVNFMEDFLIQF